MFRNKGRLAVLGLVLIVLGFGVGLATSRVGRTLYWARRMRSRDGDERARARANLMEIGRPEIDRVFAEVVAGEACDRVARVASDCVLVGRGKLEPDGTLTAQLLCPVAKPLLDFPDGDVGIHGMVPDAGSVLGTRDSDRSQLVLVTTDRSVVTGLWMSCTVTIVLVVALPADDVLAREALEATKARLASGH